MTLEYVQNSQTSVITEVSRR